MSIDYYIHDNFYFCLKLKIMKFISVVLLGFFTFFISCRELPEQINSPFQGNWSGDYQGAENGTLIFKITSEGNIVGSKISTSKNYSEEFLGYIFADGEFSCNTRNGFLFKGKITDVNAKIYSGNWTQNFNNTTFQGTFTFKKN